jgi:hypothetical protein
MQLSGLWLDRHADDEATGRVGRDVLVRRAGDPVWNPAGVQEMEGRVRHTGPRTARHGE